MWQIILWWSRNSRFLKVELRLEHLWTSWRGCMNLLVVPQMAVKSRIFMKPVKKYDVFFLFNTCITVNLPLFCMDSSIAYIVWEHIGFLFQPLSYIYYILYFMSAPQLKKLHVMENGFFFYDRRNFIWPIK